ncbi:phosphohydrolase [Salipiger sp. PrR003]|uniref:phosphohydrolase n=1 Tax=Salipiger sp. PrR003 TaxID=2706776 RepID=UPI0013DCF857|nr:phosphohydrolase [Salipiger sp. PrR003]NDV53855.1 phosphohydrolase [Salipiger sp. PrR003]
MSRIICIYHANCADGFTAAWCVRWALGETVEFIPASYGEDPPEVGGADVIIVDFSYKRPAMEELAASAKSVLVLDHHKTAEADLVALPLTQDTWRQHLRCGVRLATQFDMQRSGAQMAWDYFCQGDRPTLVNYVADRDLWRWELAASREVSAVIGSLEHSFQGWDALAARLEDHQAMIRLIDEGAAILRAHDKMVDQVTDAHRHMVIGGHRVPVANAPYALASDAAGKLAEGNLFAATYFDGPKGRTFSLRSRGGGLDVAEIAAQYGGGGHRNAAGFKAAQGWEGDAPCSAV